MVSAVPTMMDANQPITGQKYYLECPRDFHMAIGQSIDLKSSSCIVYTVQYNRNVTRRLAPHPSPLRKSLP